MGICCDVKVVLLGSAHIGKTSMVSKLMQDERATSDKYVSTIGAAFTTKRIALSSGRTLCLGIWDTAGEERFESVSRAFYRDSNVAIICYEVTYAKSWERAKRWITEIKHHEERCKIYVCGTKIDLLEGDMAEERAIPREVVRYYVSGINIPYFETSSKTGKNIDKLFQMVAEDFEGPLLQLTSRVDLKTESKKRFCCI